MIGASGLAILLGFSGALMAQSSQPHEPLPRTFEGVHQLMAPPVELQDIHLLMTPNEVRIALKKSGFQFEEDEGTVAGVHGLAVHVSQPVKGIQILSFQFREGELYSMLLEYDMRYFTSFDFPPLFITIEGEIWRASGSQRYHEGRKSPSTPSYVRLVHPPLG